MYLYLFIYMYKDTVYMYMYSCTYYGHCTSEGTSVQRGGDFEEKVEI